MLKLKRITGLWTTVIFLLLTLFPTEAFAASTVQLTSSVKASFDGTTAVADPSLKTRMNTLYAELATLQNQHDSREEKIRALHYSNQQSLLVVRQHIKEIDAQAVVQLETQVKTAKERYQPLFDQYSSLNRRISIAKSLKDKTLSKVLQNQGDALKVMVQLARQDIREKDARLKAAKETRSKKIAAARKTLAGIENPQTAIKSQKSAVTALNKRLSADWTSFKAALRKKNPATASQSLSSLVSTTRQIASNKQTIVELEQKISVIISKTEAQLGY